MTEQSEALSRLMRWEISGATWRLESLRDGTAVVALCRCDGGEQVDTLRSGEPDLVAYVLAADDES